MNSKMVKKYALLPLILGGCAVSAWSDTLTFNAGNMFLAGAICPHGGNFYHFYPRVKIDGFTTPPIAADCVHNITPTSVNEAVYTVTTPSNPSKSLTITATVASEPALSKPHEVSFTAPSSKECFFWAPGSQPSSTAVKVQGKGSVSINYDCDPHSFPITVKADVALPGIELGKTAPFNRVIVTLTNNTQNVYTLDANGNLNLPYNLSLNTISSVAFDCSVGGVGGASVCTATPVKFSTSGMVLNVAAKMVSLSLPSGIITPTGLAFTAEPLMFIPRPTPTYQKWPIVNGSVSVPLFYSVIGASINPYCDLGATTAGGCLGVAPTSAASARPAKISLKDASYWEKVPAANGLFPAIPLDIKINNTSTGPFTTTTVFNLYSNPNCTNSVLDNQIGVPGNAFHYSAVLLTPSSAAKQIFLGYFLPTGGPLHTKFPGVCSKSSNLETLNNTTAQFEPIRMKIDPKIYQYCGANASLYYSNGSKWGQLSLTNKPSEVIFNGTPLSLPGMDVFLSCQPLATLENNGACPENMKNDNPSGQLPITPVTPQQDGNESTIKAPSCSGPYYVTFPVHYCTNATQSNLKVYSDANCSVPIPGAVTNGTGPGHLTISLEKNFPQGSVPATLYTSCGNAGSQSGCACVGTQLNQQVPNQIDCSSNNITVFIPGERTIAQGDPILNINTAAKTADVLYGPGSDYASATWGTPDVDASGNVLKSISKITINMMNVPNKSSADRASNYFAIYDPRYPQSGCGWFTTPSTYGGGLLYTVDGGTGPALYYDCDDVNKKRLNQQKR